MLDCLLRARCTATLASRHVEDWLLNVVFENICGLHKYTRQISRQRFRSFINRF